MIIRAFTLGTCSRGKAVPPARLDLPLLEDYSVLYFSEYRTYSKLELTVEPSPFVCGSWIWTGNSHQNQYAVFTRNITVRPDSKITIRISASYHYELFINGGFINCGPVHTDPKWCHYDEFSYICSSDEELLHVVILVHHSGGIYIHYLVPGPPGLIAEFEADGLKTGTDESWKCLNLPMWRQDVPQRGWAHSYSEDYDAALEPDGWHEKVFADEIVESWENVVLVENADEIWSGR